MAQIVVHLTRGVQHEHIDRCALVDGSSAEVAPAAAVVSAIERGAKVFTRDYKCETAEVHVCAVNGRKYLRTVKDGKWADNLLVLPRLG